MIVDVCINWLKEAVVVSVYLLSVLHIPRTASAPAGARQHMDGRMESHPKWINPCGMHEEEMVPHDLSPAPVTDSELLNQIVHQAKIALSQADQFKDDYVKKTFNTEYQQNHEHWKAYNNDWFPNKERVPKGLGEKIPEGHLNSLQLDKALLDMFEYLQTVAVGLEQVTWDQEDENSAFHSHFHDAEYKLRVVLCEVQMAILERGLKSARDVQRDVMPADVRNIDSASFRNVRDWLIFRDYMNALEYVIEAFEVLRARL